MTRRLFCASVFICALVGVIHTSLTFTEYQQVSADAAWFAGTGIGIMFFAVANWAAWGSVHPVARTRRLVLAADVLMVALGVLGVRAVPVPQAFVLLVVFVIMAATACLLERGLSQRPSRPSAA